MVRFSEDYVNFKKCHNELFAIVGPVNHLPIEAQPATFLYEAECKSQKAAERLLEELLVDVIEATMPWSDEQIALFDEHFFSEGLPSLTNLRYRYLRLVKRIMRRGNIRDINEYRFMHGIRKASNIPVNEKEKLIGMLGRYNWD